MKQVTFLLLFLVWLGNGAAAQEQAGTAASGVSESADNTLQSSAGGPTIALNGGPHGRQLLDNYVPGDADGNRIINITDAVCLIIYIFNNGMGPVPLVAGDANCDGLVNITDATFVVNYIFGGGAPPVNCF